MKYDRLATRSLIRAIGKKNADPQLVRQLIRQGADPNAVHKREPLLFFWRVLAKAELTQALIDGHADIKARNALSETPLHEAIRFCHLDTARVLIAAGSPLGVESHLREAPLHIAAQTRSAIPVLELLLRKRANPNVLDDLGRTPLHFAALQSKNASAVRLLVEHGAKEFKDDRDLTPRDYARRRGDRAVLAALRGAPSSDRTSLTQVVTLLQKSKGEEARDVIKDLEAIASKPLTKTVRKQLVDARIGQGAFRKLLMRMWQHCPICGCHADDLLRASHIKPWSDCENKERLDPFNGLLLAPNVDTAFDKGLISFDTGGVLLVSKKLSTSDARALGIRKGMRIRLQARHQPFMKYHREHVYRRKGA